MKFAVKVFASIAAIATFNPVWAETFTYEAITDFTDINAGEVPYYRHNGVNALAINAAIEDYRDKFARATLEFEQDAGQYDVTITSLGETDGDGEFRFLVNGEVVGTSVNEPADVDYGEQLHTFENISIPQGALIGVESIAVSNGLIPEGDAYAYARGRWTTLTISDVEEIIAVPDPLENVDLGLELLVDNDTPTAGEQISVEISVENFSDDTATNPVVTVTFDQRLSNLASDTCVESTSGSMTCALAELSGNEVNNFTISATALVSGDAEISATVSTDQTDPDAANNSDSANLEIQSVVIPVVEVPVVEVPEVEVPEVVTPEVVTPVAVTPEVVTPEVVTPINVIPEVVAPVDNTVDLALSLSADKESLEVGDTIAYTVIVTNVHDSNTATSPTAGIVLPASLQFEASSTCTANELTIICETEELPPGASTEAAFSAKAVSVNSYSTVLATASSAQSESFVENNETQIITDISRITPQNVVTVTDQQASNNSTPAVTGTTSSKSGGGVLQLPAWVLLIAAAILYSRRR